MRKFLAAVLLGALTASFCMASCKKKDEEAPPMPSATVTAAPSAPAELVPEEDAGSDAADGDADDSDVKKTGTGTSTTKLVSCCRRLASNAKSAPLAQQGFMLQAAATCESFARGGNAAAVNGVLRQYNIPCN